MEKGVVEIRDLHTLIPRVYAIWCPEDEKNNKFIRKNTINLSHNAEGYYCNKCMKVVSIFDKK